MLGPNRCNLARQKSEIPLIIDLHAVAVVEFEVIGGWIRIQKAAVIICVGEPQRLIELAIKRYKMAEGTGEELLIVTDALHRLRSEEIVTGRIESRFDVMRHHPDIEI